MNWNKIRSILHILLIKYNNKKSDLKIKYELLRKKIKDEIEETNYMFEIILKKVIIGVATEEEISFVKKQGVSITQLLSTGAIISLPGGIIIFLTIQKIIKKYFKKDILPNSFLNKTEVDKINVEFEEIEKLIDDIHIIEEENMGNISPLFNIEKVYIYKFKYNEVIVEYSKEEDIIKHELIYHIDREKKISDYLPVLRKYILKNID